MSPTTMLKAGLCAGALLIHGCAVGPNYDGPPATPTSAQFVRAGALPDVTTGGESVSAWWTRLDDPALTRLIEDALAANPDVAVAQARLRSARAALSGSEAGRLPSVSATAIAGRVRAPGGLLSATRGDAAAEAVRFNLFDLGFDASWEADLFGARSRDVEAAQARAQASEAGLADLQVQLAAQVAQAYVGLREAQQRRTLLRGSADASRELLELVRRRRAAGAATEADVERLQLQWLQADAMLPALDAREAQYLDELAVLAGRTPGSLDTALREMAELPAPPPDVEIGDPAAVIRRRPDIRVAERELAASNARIGAAVAQYFPSVRLQGNLGYVATDAGHLIDSDNLAAVALPILSWNLLDFGRTRAQVAQARAGHDAALEHYRSVVLQALGDAESAVSRFGHQRQTVQRLDAARRSAVRAEDLVSQRLEAGTASLIDLLDARRQRLRTEQDFVEARAGLTLAWVSLQKSLGLGWSGPPQLANR